MSQCLPISTRMIILLCHSPHLWEPLGGLDETCQLISRSGCQVDLRPTLRVRCLGGKSQPHPRPGDIWERQRLAYFVSSKEYPEFFDIATEPVVFEWRICPGHTTGQLFEEVQKMVDENQVHPFHFKERIIFMSMFNDLDWSHKHNKEICRHKSSRVSAFAKLGAGHFSALQMMKSGMGPCLANQKEIGATLPKLLRNSLQRVATPCFVAQAQCPEDLGQVKVVASNLFTTP